MKGAGESLRRGRSTTISMCGPKSTRMARWQGSETLRLLKHFSEREIEKATGLHRSKIRLLRHGGTLTQRTYEKLQSFLPTNRSLRPRPPNLRMAKNNRSKSVWTLFKRKLLNNQTVWPVIFGLTGPMCARALKSLHLFELHARGHHDWPVKPTIPQWRPLSAMSIAVLLLMRNECRRGLGLDGGY